MDVEGAIFIATLLLIKWFKKLLFYIIYNISAKSFVKILEIAILQILIAIPQEGNVFLLAMLVDPVRTLILDV